jgi:hypothetical protein
MPIEDLLTTRSDAAGCGLIRRDAASLAVSYLKKHTDGQPWTEIDAMLRDIAASDHERLNEIGQWLWPWAVGVLGPAVAEALTERRVSRELLGDSRELLPDLRQLVLFLSMGAAVQELKELLPVRPLSRLSPQVLDRAERLIRRVHEGDPERLYVMLLTITLRMTVPGEFFEYAPHLCTGFDAAARAAVLSRLSLLVVSDMNFRTAELEAQPDLDPVKRAASASRLISALTAAERTTRRHDPTMKLELAALRRKASAVVREVVADAAEAMNASVQNGIDAPDAQRTVEKNLAALRKVQGFADKVAMRGVVDRAIEAVADQARVRAEEALKSAAAFQAMDGVDLSTQRHDIVASIRMLELAGRLEEADVLRRTAIGMLKAPAPEAKAS